MIQLTLLYTMSDDLTDLITARCFVSDGESHYLVTVRDIPQGINVQGILSARSDEVWALAQITGDPADPLDQIDAIQSRAIKALGLLAFDQINTLRGIVVFFHPGASDYLPQITIEQFKQAWIDKIREL